MWLRALLLLCLLVPALDGCRHRDENAAAAAAEGPRVNARRLRRLLAIAARDLTCPVDRLVHEQVTGRVYRVRGCTDWRDYAIFGGRRARWRRILPIGERAVGDFGCTVNEITFTPTSPTSYTAVGCGRAAGYELRCSATDCGWMAGAAPSAAGTAMEASVVVIVPIDGATLSLDVDGETEDDGDE
jgi:hypothetical protein